MSVRELEVPRKQVRVLVADDDPLFRSLVAANLGNKVDSVVEAADGYLAWDLLLNRTFELALVDLSMPNIDGFTLIQCMRGHPRTRHLPIIVITSSTDGASIKRAFEVGATSFLTKPVNWSLFGHHIDYLVRLNQAGNLARATMQQAEAVARAKDAVIAKLAARIREHSDRIAASARAELDGKDGKVVSLSAAGLASTAMRETAAIDKLCAETLPHIRSVTEQIVVDDRPLQVRRLIETGIAQAAALAAETGVEVVAIDPAHPLKIHCDERALTLAITHLLRNAIQHSAAGSKVHITAEHRNDNVLAITVTDQGKGADPEHIARCLRPLDETIEGDQLPASGLGLPMAKAIVQAHGGLLEVSTAPAEGTVATLILPAEIIEVCHDSAA